MKKVYDNLFFFKTLINSGSFSQASSVLGIAHTTISRQISQLEDQLGKKLITRSNKGIELTSAGRILYNSTLNHLESIEKVLDDVEGNISNLDDENIPVKIFLSIGFSYFFIYNIYPKLKEKIPNIKIELSTYTFNMMEREILKLKNFIQHFDICITEDLFFHAINPDHWNIVTRRSDIMKIFASKEYIGKYGEPKKLEDLKDHNCLYTNLWSKTRWNLLDENNKEHSIVINGNFATDVLVQLRDLVRLGYGIGLLPEKYFEEPSEENYEIVNLLPEYKTRPFDTIILTNIHAQDIEKTQQTGKAIKDICMEIFQQW